MKVYICYNVWTVFLLTIGILELSLVWCLSVTEKNALASELQMKTYVASNQRVSGIDAQRINSQLLDLKTQLNQADEELANLDRELNAEEQLYSQEKMLVSFYLQSVFALFRFPLSSYYHDFNIFL